MTVVAFARRAPSRATFITAGLRSSGFLDNCPAAASSPAAWDRRAHSAQSTQSASRIHRDAEASAAGTGIGEAGRGGVGEERGESGVGGGGSGDDGAPGSARREAVAQWAAGAETTVISLRGTRVESEGARAGIHWHDALTPWRAGDGGGWPSGAEPRRGGAAEGALAGVGGRRYGGAAAREGGGMRRAGGGRGDAAHTDECEAGGEAEWGEAYWRKQLARLGPAERGGKGERRRRRKAKEGKEMVEWWPGQRQQRGAGGAEEGARSDEEMVAAVGMEVAHEKAMYLPPSPILAGPPPPWRVEEREGVADLWLTRAFQGEQLRLMLLLQGHEGGLADQEEEGEEEGAGEGGVGSGESDAGIPALILVSKPVRAVQAGGMAASSARGGVPTRHMGMGMGMVGWAGLGGREGAVMGRPVGRMKGEGQGEAAWAAAAGGGAAMGGEGEVRLRVHCTIAGDRWRVNHVSAHGSA
ncbi:unnamed protein product [Closterium sp. NIES-53]